MKEKVCHFKLHNQIKQLTLPTEKGMRVRLPRLKKYLFFITNKT